MTTIAKLGVDLFANSSKFKGGLDKASKDLNSFSARSKRMTAGLQKEFKGFTKSIFSVQTAMAGLVGSAVVLGLKKTSDLWAEQEKQVRAVNAALQSTGKFSEAASQKIQKSASDIQKLTTFGDEAILKATAVAMQFTKELDVDQTSRMQQAIVGLADALEMDLKAAALAVGKSIGSQTNALSRYGIQLDVNASQQDKLNQLMAQTGSMFDQAVSKTDSLQGRTKQMENAFGDLLETIGSVITEGNNGQSVIVSITNAIVSMDQMIQANRNGIVSVLQDIANGFGTVAGQIFRATSEAARFVSGLSKNPVLGKALGGAGKGLATFGMFAGKGVQSIFEMGQIFSGTADRKKMQLNNQKFMSQLYDMWAGSPSGGLTKALPAKSGGFSPVNLQQFGGGSGAPHIGGGGKKGKKAGGKTEAEKAAEAAEREIERLRSLYRSIDELAKQSTEDFMKPLIDSLEKSASITDETSSAIQKYVDKHNEAAQMLDAAKTPQQRLNDEIQRANYLYAEGFLSLDQYVQVAGSLQTELDKLGETGKDSLKELENAVQNFGKKFEDTLINAFMTGEFAFKNMIGAMLEDLSRLILRMSVINPAVNAAVGLIDNIGSGLAVALFGGGGASRAGRGAAGAAMSLMGFADGGDVYGGKLIVVGERGPEIFMPRTPGTVVANHDLGTGGTTVQVNINMSPGLPGTVRAELAQMMPEIQKQTQQGVMSAIGRGGKMARAVGIKK